MICPNKNTPEWKALSKAQPKLAYYLWNKYDGAVPSNYYNSSSFVSYQLPNQQKEYIASEKTIRDLAARMSDRIGIPVRFESDRSKQYKGKLEDNVAVVNLAYATLDTPIHEVLGHPIIRAIKDRKYFNGSIDRYNDAIVEFDEKNPKATREEAIAYADKKVGNNQTDLYQNLLKELEYGKGKEILDRVKIDYVYKSINDTDKYPSVNEYGLSLNAFIEAGIQNGRTAKQIKEDLDKNFSSVDGEWLFFNYSYGQNFAPEFPGDEGIMPVTTRSEVFDILGENKIAYTLEEQQEEAIVELLGLYTAERLDKVKEGKLISLLKRLLKEIKAFMKDLLSLDEIEVNKLPDNMTLGDLADLLAYSNSKLILPGNEVIYTTPDNQKFKTYGEASKYISELAKNVEDVDLSDNISIENIDKQINELQKELDNFKFEVEPFNKFVDVYTKQGRLRQNYWARRKDGTTGWTGGAKETLTGDDYDGFVIDTNRGDGRFITKISDEEAEKIYYAQENGFNITTKESREKYAELETKLHNLKNNSLKGFIEKNKEYEQSKEIIEEWKKVNNIQYNPEEVYSRGQEFVSVVGAYSDFDVNLMMQNLLQHIEDNQKAGGEFTISAFTKPVDKTIGHLDGGGGKIKFKIYPKSQDIKWASNTDVFSGSVWDASTKVSKDKKSELLGVSYTKYPSLSYVPTVAPNLASIIDKLAHHHNELGISLTGNNFRIEYDDDIPYSTKKIINAVNSILDQKYGKLKKPQIQQTRNFTGLTVNYKGDSSFKTVKSYESDIFRLYDISNGRETIKGLRANEFDFIEKVTNGIQPTQTNETLKQSIDSVKEKLNENNLQDEDMPFAPKEQRKEYTSQALINTKIAKLKEVAKKYPRSLIRSEVVRTSEYYPGEFSGFAEDELPFQKISSTQTKPGVAELFESNAELANIGTPQQYSQYLDSIFPESKVKDILYHSRFTIDNIKNKDRWKNGFYSGTRDQADLMAEMAEYGSNDLMTTVALLINMQNPKVTDFVDRKVENYKNTNDGFIIEATQEDALQLIGDRDGYNPENFKKEYVVFEPEQIHILGNKQDIEGFKQFVSNSNPMTSPDMSNLENTEFEVIKCRED